MPSTPIDPWLPTTAPLGWAAAEVQVFAYNPQAAGGPVATRLPNVVCMSIMGRLGPDPGIARLRYRFGTGDPEAPANWEESVSDALSLNKAIIPGDRIVVRGRRPSDGEWEFLFDGLALGFEMTVAHGREVVSIICMGIAFTCWNTPIPGAWVRNGSDPMTEDDQLIQADWRFNPKGLPNRIPDEAARRQVPVKHASDTREVFTFLDVENRRFDDADKQPQLWRLPDALAYLIYQNNLDETLIRSPDQADLDKLQARVPKSGQAYDPWDASSYDKKDIVISDKPFIGRPWPVVANELVTDKGFALRWTLASDDTGDDGPVPYTQLELIRLEDQFPHSLQLQPRGEILDLSQSNVAMLGLGRNFTELVNEIEVRGELEEFEVSFILTPGTPADPADAADTASLGNYDRTGDEFATAYFNDYRLHIFDESGEGHYAPAGSVLSNTPTALDAVLGDPAVVQDRPIKPYAIRRRKPLGELITKDPRGRPLKARLSISTDYTVAASASVTIASGTTGGTFTVSVTEPGGSSAQTTSGIAHDANAPTIQAALEALSNVAPGDLIVSQSGAKSFTIAAAGTFAGQALGGLTVNGAGLTGAGAGVSAALNNSLKSAPGLWDGTGTWQPVNPGAFRLLDDRIGVWISGKNPNEWHIGESKEFGHPYPGGVVKAVESLAKPSKANPVFALRLTCVIRGDRRLVGLADSKLNPPITDYAVRRTVDAHDRYKTQTIVYPSEFNKDPAQPDPVVPRDDTARAVAEATAMQLAAANGVLSGPVEIPWLTTRYQPGDRIRDIDGRRLSLDTSNSGGDAAPTYPTVVARHFKLDGERRTILELSDANMARHNFRRQVTRRRDPNHA